VFDLQMQTFTWFQAQSVFMISISPCWFSILKRWFIFPALGLYRRRVISNVICSDVDAGIGHITFAKRVAALWTRGHVRLRPTIATLVVATKLRLQSLQQRQNFKFWTHPAENCIRGCGSLPGRDSLLTSLLNMQSGHSIFEVEYLKNCASCGQSYYSTLIGNDT